MNEIGFAAQMTQRGCVGDGTQFCGSFNGYPFVSVYMNGREGGRTSFQIRMTMGGAVNGRKLLKATRNKTKGIVKPVWNNALNIANTVVLQADCRQDTEFGAVFDAMLGGMVESAAELGYGVPDVCPVCRGMGCDSYAFYENGYRPAHDACVRGKAVDMQAKHDKNQRSGSYLLGLVGALLGAMVGAVPNLLLMMFLRIISGWVCALIPIGAYYGYRLIGGKRTKLATLFVVLASVLAVPVMDFVMYYVILSQDYGITFTVANYLELFAIGDVDAITGLLQEFFFTLLGVFVSWGIIRRDGGSEVREVSFSVDTLRPINAPALQSGAAAAQPMAATPVAPGAENDAEAAN